MYHSLKFFVLKKYYKLGTFGVETYPSFLYLDKYLMETN